METRLKSKQIHRKKYCFQFYQHFTRTFYVRKFRSQLLYLHFRFVFIWRNTIGTKAAHKMLVKFPWSNKWSQTCYWTNFESIFFPFQKKNFQLATMEGGEKGVALNEKRAKNWTDVSSICNFFRKFFFT